MAEKTNEETRPKRDAILEAARELFAQKGYEETTIADIAKAAGMAVGTVYLYFRNKHEVYTAVAINVEAKLAQAFQDPAFLDLPFGQKIRAMIDAGFRVSREQKHLMSFLQIDMQSANEILQHREANEQITHIVDNVLRHAIERGELAVFNTEMYAQLLDLMAGAVYHQCFAVENGEREELYRTYLIEFVERLFFGPSLREGKKDIRHV